MLSWVVHADGDAYTRACVLAVLDELGLIIAFVTFAVPQRHRGYHHGTASVGLKV